MKKRLNIITFIIGVAVGISYLNSESISVLKECYRLGVDDGDESQTELVYLSLETTESLAMPNELMNKKSGELMPASIKNATVKVAVGERSMLNLLSMILCIIILSVGELIVAYSFLRIIFAVNKSVIFEWVNVKRLRIMGIGFILMFIGRAILGFIQKYSFFKIMDIENYKIINSSFDGSILMFGVISFLVAEIFAVGLRLKEDQELTI
jgi:hypothetical protein